MKAANDGDIRDTVNIKFTSRPGRVFVSGISMPKNPSGKICVVGLES